MSSFKSYSIVFHRIKEFFFTVLRVVVAHSAVVERMRMKRKIEPEFGAGSVDEQLVKVEKRICITF